MFSHSDVAAIPSSIGDCVALETLQASFNNISSVPTELGKLGKLRKIDLFSNPLRALPSHIGLLTSLTEFNVFHTRISVLPTQIGKLTSLTQLYIHDNELTSIPTEIEQLSALDRFRVYQNQLRNMPFPSLFSIAISECLGQGVYADAVGMPKLDSVETNCFSSCPDNCCESSALWPDCADTVTNSPTPLPSDESAPALVPPGSIATEPTTELDKPSGLSVGAKVGIGIGIGVPLLALICIGVAFLVRQCKKAKHTKTGAGPCGWC